MRARVPVRGRLPLGSLHRAREGRAVQPRVVGALGGAAAPEGAKEFTLLFSGGLIRRVGLILKNEESEIAQL